VQTALALSGVVSTIREYPSRNPAHKPKLLVYAPKEPYTSINTARDVTVREYEGLVYCASVESSYILIRRNSKISVVGQCQNLPRITPDKPKPSDALRKSMRAPEGYKVIVADQSGIELRVNHFLWKVPSSMALYKKDRKADLYKAFAAVRYGISPEEVTKEQRQLAKLCQLGLGFGCGWKKFKLIAKTMGGLDLSDAEAEAVTTDWRNSYPEIVRGWRVCHEALQWIHDGVERPIDPWGLCWTSKYGIRLPSGRFIRYPNLHLEKTSDGNYEWWYGQGRHRTRIYAGKVTENCIQALARDIIADNMFTFYKETGLYPALMVHDELVYVVPENQAEKLLDKLQQIMRTPPQWWPDIVLESEGDIADTYGDAK
jgi:DNA polymerase